MSKEKADEPAIPFGLGSQLELGPTEKVRFDLHRPPQPLSPLFRFCIGSDRAAIGFREDYLAQARVVKKSCGFEYIRFHGLLSDEMEVVRTAQGKIHFNFERIDQLFDSLLKIGLRPFVELSFMPTALASGPETIFWWKGNITRPAEPALWEQLIFELASHLVERYGAPEVSTWYFEVWNEPDLPNFFKGSMSDYFELYEITAKTIKRACPTLRVGGPATAEHRWIREFLEFCESSSTPLNFISTHGYCVEGAVDEAGKKFLVLPKNETTFVNGVTATAATVASSYLPALEIHYTEWSSSYSSRDSIHDHYFSCAFLLSRIFALRHTVKSLAYWTFSDIFEELGPPTATFHGGFGLLTLDGIPKPVFFLFKYLQRLKQLELSESQKGVWLTVDGQSIVGLIWEELQIPQGVANKALFTQLLPPSKIKSVEITLKNVPDGDYIISLHRVGFEANDSYSPYLQGAFRGIVDEQKKSELLSKTADLPELRQSIKVKHSTYSFSLLVREGDVLCFEIEPKK